MHPMKRELLDRIAASAAAQDDLLTKLAGVALRPHVYGWRRSLRAAVPMPLVGFSGILHGIAYVAASRTRETKWERSYPRGRDVTDLVT